MVHFLRTRSLPSTFYSFVPLPQMVFCWYSVQHQYSSLLSSHHGKNAVFICSLDKCAGLNVNRQPAASPHWAVSKFSLPPWSSWQLAGHESYRLLLKILRSRWRRRSARSRCWHSAKNWIWLATWLHLLHQFLFCHSFSLPRCLRSLPSMQRPIRLATMLKMILCCCSRWWRSYARSPWFLLLSLLPDPLVSLLHLLLCCHPFAFFLHQAQLTNAFAAFPRFATLNLGFRPWNLDSRNLSNI